ncbi:class I SAM-dependent RNA methyltransferase [Microbacterium sp. gxy059]|uniref:class I SAM-dependent RNA methyltransferase n=1 Tax=Microbacterium sp. gxy059 TaxID=2957199 RepID=UPI003D97E143
MQTGDIVDLDVTGVAHGGVFIARHREQGEERPLVVFVPDAIPGERVRARITQAKRSFARAEALEVLDASPHRRTHVWRAADIDRAPEDRPGGADFGHIDLAHQRALKRTVIEEAFERFAGGSVPVTVDPAGVDEDARGARWRTRVGLHVDGEGTVGAFAARSRRVAPAPDLPLATEAIERAALGLRGEREGRIDLVQPEDGRVRVLRRPADRRARRTPAGAVVEKVGEREFRVDADGFWQVHRLAPGALDAAVRDALSELPVEDGARHLDLYGGVGLFASALGAHGDRARVTTVESAPAATRHAAENLRDLGVEAVTARVERYVQSLARDADAERLAAIGRGVTLLDPPRSGAGEEVVQAISDLGPRAVVYVACDPVALARDVGAFRARGYDADRVRGLDLFPSSHHVEAIVVLTRR